MNEKGTATNKDSIYTQSLWQHHQLWVYGCHLTVQKQNNICPKIRTHFSAAYCYTTISGSSGWNHGFFKMWYKAATDKLSHIFLPKSGHSREGLSSSAHSLQKSQLKSGLQSQPQRLVISDKLHHLKTGLNKDIKFTSNKPLKDQMGTQNNFKNLNRYKLFSWKYCYSNPENENMTNFWKSHLLS